MSVALALQIKFTCKRPVPFGFEPVTAILELPGTHLQCTDRPYDTRQIAHEERDALSSNLLAREESAK